MERENTRTGGTSSQTLYKKWEKENIQKIALSKTQSDLANDTLSQIREGERWVS